MLKHVLFFTIVILSISFGESRKYKVVVARQPPFIEKTKNGFRGLLIDLMFEIATLLDIDTIVQVPIGEMGHMNEKNEWNGLVRELIDKVIYIRTFA